MKRLVWLSVLSIFWWCGPSWGQQNPNGVLPLANVPHPYALLIRDPVVHAELKLTEEQKQSLQTLNDKLDLTMWSLRNKPASDSAKGMQSIIDQSKQRLSQVLTPEQRERLEQIQFWVMGLKALVRPDVASRLSLSSEQTATIRQVLTSAEKEVAELQRELQSGGDADALNARFREVQRERQEKIVAILEERQKQVWLAMLGPRLDTSKLGRVRFKAPEFERGSGWVNTPPLTMEKLKGKVVALHFYAFA